MGIAGKLISAAVTIGTAAAVGYGLKKLGNKLEQAHEPEPEQAEPEIIGTADSSIALSNTGGGKWSYQVGTKGVVKGKEDLSVDQQQRFDFVPLRDGVTEIEFDYIPNQSAGSTRTITYRIEVKNGKIVRCDAAGDLEMLAK